MSISLKYLDIKTTLEDPNKFGFNVPNQLSGESLDCLRYDFLIEKTHRYWGKFHRDRAGGSYEMKTLRGDIHFLNLINTYWSKYSPNDISDICTQEKVIISSELTEESRKAVEAWFKHTKPKKPIFIGPVWLDSTVGFTGTCLYVTDTHIAFVANDAVQIVTLKEGKNYEKELREFKAVNLSVLSKKSFPIIVRKHTDKIAKDTLENARYDNNNVVAQVKDYKNKIKSLSVGIVSTKKGLSEIKELQKTLSPGAVAILEEGAKLAKTKIASLDSLVKQYAVVNKGLKTSTEKVRFIEEGGLTGAEDYALVKRMLKTGVIEKLETNKEGISWTYPPTTYKPEPGKEVFLGRIRVVVGQALRMFVESYPSNNEGDGHYFGTWHIDNRETGDHYCLGSYSELIFNAIARRSISECIVILKDFIQTANKDSILITPNWDLMNLTKPSVIDDSFEVWRKKNGK